jgi:hypothetical protein
MSGDTNIVGFACWFARIYFVVRGVDLICSTTEFIYLLSWSPWKIGPKTPSDHVDSYQSKLIRAYTLCIQIYPNPYSDHNLTSKIYFRMNPIAVAFFTVLHPIASLPKFLEPLHKHSNSNMRIWVFSTIGIILCSLFFSTKVNPMIIPIHRDHLDTTLIQYHIYLNLACLAHIYSNFSWVIWVNCVVFQS